MPYDKTATASGLVETLAAHIEGKVVLTTGVSPGGLGATFVEAVARARPSLLVLAARNPDKAAQAAASVEAAAPGVRTRVLALDLGSLAKARAAADEVNAWDDVPAVDVLVNNAGIMAVPYGLTVDGHETQFATNHLAPFLFTNLIMDKLLAAEAPRVVNVSSDGHRLGHIRWADYDFAGGETYVPWVAYGQSKTANMLFSLSLAAKLGDRGLLALSLHPGVIKTNLANTVGWDVPGLSEFFFFPSGTMDEMKLTGNTYAKKTPRIAARATPRVGPRTFRGRRRTKAPRRTCTPRSIRSSRVGFFPLFWLRVSYHSPVGY